MHTKHAWSFQGVNYSFRVAVAKFGSFCLAGWSRQLLNKGGWSVLCNSFVSPEPSTENPCRVRSQDSTQINVDRRKLCNLLAIEI